jgi:hypothetical protein
VRTPTEFGIRFLDDGFLYECFLKVDLSPFMDREHSRRILGEKLSVNEKQIFRRGEEAL